MSFLWMVEGRLLCWSCAEGGGRGREGRQEKGSTDPPPEAARSTIPGPGTAGDLSVPLVAPDVPVSEDRT